MKIWLDLRFIADNLYSAFIIDLVKWLVQTDTNNFFNIYTNIRIDWLNFKNASIKNVSTQNFSIKEQTTYLKILNNEKNNLMIFFNHYKPVFYKWDYFILLPSLKDIYYSNFSNYFEKYGFLYLLEKNLKKSKKIICLDRNTQDELIEKFNIEERKINHIDWFFPIVKEMEKENDIKIDIKIKYDIKNKYFIYSWWEWVEKNYEKLIYVFEKLIKNWEEIDLIFLWDTISRNIWLRNLVLKLNLQKNIHFMWVIKTAEKKLFYNDSIWVIFPSFYEPFPFRLTEPIYYNTKIISSDLKNIKWIFWENIKYFSPISVNSIFEQINNNLEKDESIINYESIKEKYTKENSVNQLIEIIK